VPSYQVTYRGPSTFAVPAAALLADAEGVELTSAAAPEHPVAADHDSVLLTVTVAGSEEAVTAGLDAVRELLPAGATFTVDG
jgi:hypothetical protein